MSVQCLPLEGFDHCGDAGALVAHRLKLNCKR
jgi:hypothetical protein